ncbi:MAG: ThuA domain-containing protein [Verrucomicrobiales bacterium]|nr:ThuA domain-containing protein [Verrucomicrobiales bacterium]
MLEPIKSKSLSFLLLSLVCVLLCGLPAGAAPLVYEGEAGPGKGKHLVFVASDHEYRSEEALPMLARILAKHHGFKCSVVFGVDGDGVIKPGASNVPGIEALKTADLLVLFTRFQNWPEEQMQHFVDYLDRAGPIVGLRTATHGFKIPNDSKFAKFGNGFGGEAYAGGFGRQVLGEKWAGHYGRNHKQSTRIDLVPEKKGHPVLRGVEKVWAECAGYKAAPLEPSEILAMAQPVEGMTRDAAAVAGMAPVPAAWTRSYAGKDGASGRVFTSTYGASGDFVNDGFRRMLVNACFWGAGLEGLIREDLEIGFVGDYQPHWHGRKGRKTDVRPEDLAGWGAAIWPDRD